MTELIKSTNASYILYEELILKKENLRREAAQFYVDYMRLFGDQLAEVFRKKIECIRKKKMIAFCQRCVNQGKTINAVELHSHIDAEMAEYEAELNRMKEEAKAAQNAKIISREDVRKIREIYYRLARKIHPDMRPETSNDPKLLEYWNRIVNAYRYNCLEKLQELEVLVNAYLSDNGIDTEKSVIPDIGKKIARTEKEIERIISTTPYTYRFLLEDDVQVNRKLEELQDEIEEYMQYSAELDEVLKNFPVKEMYA